MRTLHLPPDTAPYRDENPPLGDGTREYISSRDYQIEESVVDRYVADGWEYPGEDGEDSDESDSSTDAKLGLPLDSAGEFIEVDKGEWETDSSDENETVSVEDFAERQWRSVTSDIEDGQADQILGELDTYERNRDTQRESVIQSIRDRMTEISRNRDDIPSR